MLDFFPTKFPGVDCKKFNNIATYTKTRVIGKYFNRRKKMSYHLQNLSILLQ